MRQNTIRGEGGDHGTVCRSTAKKEKMTPSDHTHSHTHNVHSAWILLIALLRKLRSILISQLSAETKTLSKKKIEKYELHDG